MYHPTDRIAHTTVFVTPVMEHWLEREIAQWVHPMKDRSDNPSHHPATGAVMRQTSGWLADLPSTLLRKDAYIADPVTLPTQWCCRPDRLTEHAAEEGRVRCRLSDVADPVTLPTWQTYRARCWGRTCTLPPQWRCRPDRLTEHAAEERGVRCRPSDVADLTDLPSTLLRKDVYVADPVTLPTWQTYRARCWGRTCTLPPQWRCRPDRLTEHAAEERGVRCRPSDVADLTDLPSTLLRKDAYVADPVTLPTWQTYRARCWGTRRTLPTQWRCRPDRLTEHAAEERGVRCRPSDVADLTDLPSTLLRKDAYVADPVTLPTWQTYRARCWGTRRTLPTQWRCRPDRLTEHAAEEGRVRCRPSDVADLTDLPSTLLRNEAYVADPVTLPTWQTYRARCWGRTRTLPTQWRCRPDRLTEHAAEERGVRCRPSDVADLTDLPSTLLRNEAYVADPVTLPTWQTYRARCWGRTRTLPTQWRCRPDRLTEHAAEERGVRCRPSDVADLTDLPSTLLRKDAYVADPVTLPTWQTYRARCWGTRRTLPTQWRCRPDRLTEHAAEEGRVRCRPSDVADQGRVSPHRPAVERLPSLHGTRTPHLHLHHMPVGEAESTALAIICAD